MESTQRKLPKRTWLSFLVIFLLIPGLIYLGGRLGGRSYYAIGVAVILLTSIPFFLVFERRQPQAREVVMIAVLCAIAVAARVVIPIPNFKPMMAVVMLAGIAFGPEAGFLVGAMAAFSSNFIFGQGPWTPWQMFAYGMGGFLAGGAARLKLLPKENLPMAVFGFFCILLVVGPILDTCSVFTMPTLVTWASASAIYLSGLPMNLMHGATTALTLFLLGKPILGKLERVQLKYGMIAETDDTP